MNELTPKVQRLDPSNALDFGPLKNDISRLSNKGFVLKRDVEYREDDAKRWNAKANKILEEANQLFNSSFKEIDLVNTIISEVQSLAKNTEAGSGPKIDNALREAQEILDKIKQVSFIEDRDKATDQANQANILVSEMISYEEPVKKLELDTDSVRGKVSKLSDEIDDMYNQTRQADDLAYAAEKINFENRKLVDSSSPAALKDTLDKAKEDISEGENLNKAAERFFDEAQYNFINFSNFD